MASSRPERQSWKRRSSPAPRSTGSRRSARWVLTFTAAALLVLLVWIVVRQMGRADRTHFVALLAGNHAKLSVPSVPFAQHDLRPLREGSPEDLAMHDWSQLLESDRFAEFGRELERMNLGQRDTLIVYVSAHGVSNLADDEQAHILCRDFDVNHPERSRILIEDLLKQFDRSKAERKLLVLDTGYLPSDLRLGMLVNEFPRQVRRAVEASSQDDLWVLLSNDVCQSNTVLGAHSAFGQSVVDGLLGAANANDDRRVDLVELFRYVTARCGHESGGRQTVQLLQSGVASPDLPNMAPFHVSTIETPAEETPTEAAAPKDEPAEAAEPVSAKSSEKTADRTNDPLTRLTAQSAGTAPRVPASGTASETQVTPTTAGQTAPAGPGSDPAAPAPAGGANAAAASGEKSDATSAASSSADSPTSSPAASPGASAESANRSNSSSTAAPEATADAPAPAPTSAQPSDAGGAATGDESQSMRENLDRAWALRDQLQQATSGGDEWLPLEYAPHLWRELNHLLLDSELWLLSGPNRSLALQVEKHVEGLQALVSESAPGDLGRASAVGDLVTDRLRRAGAEFQQSTSRQQFQPTAEPLEQVANDVRRLRRIVYFLPDYVHWYGLSSVATPDDEDQLDRVLAERIERLLSGSAELQDLLRPYRGQPLSRTLPAQLRDQVDQLVQTQRQLEARLAERLAQAMARPDIPAFRRQLTVFLQTSLPSLSQRKQIREALAAAVFGELQRADRAPADTAGHSVSPKQWQRLVRRWRMDEALIRLADPQFSLVPAPASYQDTDEVWRQLRQMGQHVRKVHRDLADSTGPFAAQPDADRMQLLDGRDAPSVAALDRGFPEFALMPPTLPVRLDVVWSEGSEMPLTEDWQDVELTLSTTSTEAMRVTLAFQFDPSAVELQTASGQSVQPGSYPPAELRSTRSLALRIRARTMVMDPGELTLRPIKVTAQAANLRAEAELRCLLPKPDDVILIAQRVGASGPEVSVSGADQMILLRTHPNRATHYRLQLRNVSGLPRSVHVRLLAIPDIPRAEWPPGRILGADQQPKAAIWRSLFEPDRQRWLPTLHVLAETKEPLSLPADGEAIDLVFPQTPAPPSEPASAAADPAAASPPPAPLVDISRGLLFSIEEGDKRWLKWIELQPIPPRDYVKVHVNYDLQRLNIQLRPRGEEQLPLGLEQTPIPIAWEIDRLIEDQLQVGDRVETGTMATRSDAVQLYADVVSSRARQASVRLNVDRYPRAFIFEVPLDRRSEQDDPRRDLPELVIQSVSVSNFPRVYVTSDAERRAILARRAEDDKREIVVLQPSDTAAFPKPNLGDEMEIHLRADASVSAFGRADEQDRIVVQLKDRLGVTTFEEVRYADRDARFQLVEFTEGRLSIQTQVDDHRIVTGPQRMEGEYQLLAAMLVGSEELRYPRIPVVFDGQPPSVRRPLAVMPAQQQVGKAVEAMFEVTDQSGIAKIEVGLIKTLTDPLDDKSKVVLEGPRDRSVRLQLAAEEPGDYWVKAVVTDRVGHVTETRLNSSFEPIRVRFKPAAPETPATEAKVVGRVFGVTQIGSRKIDRIEVTLTGDKDFPPVVTNNGGAFEFRDVPAGKYTLTAKGYWNGERVGELPLELKEPGDYGPRVMVLKPKPRDEK